MIGEKVWNNHSLTLKKYINIYSGSNDQERREVKDMDFECSLLHAIMVHGNVSSN